jgi:methylenetetrahydrofolate dehydrogenase (NADP+) / methenyltetrahydrofolate cyclohydrolase
MTTIIDGKTLSQKIKSELKEKTNLLKNKPGLAIVLIGSDPASEIYVNSKIKACAEIGFYSEKNELKETVGETEIFNILKKLNNNKKIHGILVQFPLPEKLQYLEEKIINYINPAKDVDCFNPVNIGKLFTVKKDYKKLMLPCTPKGIIRLLKGYKIEISGKKVVICGRSNLVGKPLSLLFLLEGATVTICHSQTKNLFFETSQGDIVVTAIGKENFFTEKYFKKAAVVIDVGINRIAKKICGDVNYKNVFSKVSAISPVPGGVGPMTVAMLMENVFLAYENQT